MILVQGLCQSALEISQILCFLVLGCIVSILRPCTHERDSKCAVAETTVIDGSIHLLVSSTVLASSQSTFVYTRQYTCVGAVQHLLPTNKHQYQGARDE